MYGSTLTTNKDDKLRDLSSCRQSDAVLQLRTVYIKTDPAKARIDFMYSDQVVNNRCFRECCEHGKVLLVCNKFELNDQGASMMTVLQDYYV